mmetsp:Transcript_16882/g.23470  ORF Transcript_16882/g.23470 Transcript_16882/m.23470 type:complete len:694 (+) Transcript_16882:117-2198(+)
MTEAMSNVTIFTEQKPQDIVVEEKKEGDEVLESNQSMQLSPKSVFTTNTAGGTKVRECDFDTELTQLYSQLQNKNWDATIARSNEAPTEASTWISRKEKNGKLRWRLLPLHSAIIFKAPESVIEALLCAYPKGAQCKDDQGMLPIHLAFRNGATEDVVNLLLVAFPKSIEVKDRKGRIPLELAQASASPNKDAFIKALERGPSYYAVAAAATERAAVTAEQRAIFDTKITSLRSDHAYELETLRTSAESEKKEMEAKIATLEQELTKTEETSQVLVDHVNSLEAQLASRSDTERFLATKIAALDSDLKESNESKAIAEAHVNSEKSQLLQENEELKAKLAPLLESTDSMKAELLLAQQKAEQVTIAMEEQKATFKSDLAKYELDFLNEKANCVQLEAQLANKIESEGILASQVSTLAGRLAASAADSGSTTNAYASRVRLLEEERSALRSTVKALTVKLSCVAQALETMTQDQENIVQAAATHEAAMADAAEAHAAIVAEAKAHDAIYEKQTKERQQVAALLQRQEAELEQTKIDRLSLMEKVTNQDEQMEESARARENLVASVQKQNKDMQALIERDLKFIPQDLAGASSQDEAEKEKTENMIDAVVQSTVAELGEVEAAKKEEVSTEAEAEDATTEEADVAAEAEDAKTEEANVAVEAETIASVIISPTDEIDVSVKEVPVESEANTEEQN